MAQFDWSTLIPSAAPIQDADLDPDKVRASGDPMGMIAAAKAGVPYQAKPGQMGRTLTADGPQPQSSPIGAVQRTGISSPPSGGAVTTNDAESSGPPAVPSTVNPSGNQAGSRFLRQKEQILNTAQSLPSAPDMQQLQTSRQAAVASAPNPGDAQYKPSLKSRFARGLEGVGLGLAEGGLRGAIAGGIAPQTTGLAGYRDPNSAFSRAKSASDQNIASIDQEIGNANTQEQNRTKEIDALTKAATAAGSGVGQANELTPKPPPEKGIDVQTYDYLRNQGKTPEEAYKTIQSEHGEPGREQSAQNHADSEKDRAIARQQAQQFHSDSENDRALTRQQMEQNRIANAGNKDKGTVLKAYAPVQDSAERMNVMTQNAEDALKGNQQAGLSLLSNHIGMTMGLVKGARINKEIYAEAEKSQPWLQGITAHWDKDGYLTGVALSPRQVGQMVDLAPGRLSEDAKKARSTAKYLGSDDDGPEREPSRSTMRYYLFKSGGDKEKAKAAAAADGWTVSNGSK